jgi:hypothetical protein
LWLRYVAHFSNWRLSSFLAFWLRTEIAARTQGLGTIVGTVTDPSAASFHPRQ